MYAAEDFVTVEQGRSVRVAVWESKDIVKLSQRFFTSYYEAEDYIRDKIQSQQIGSFLNPF